MQKPSENTRSETTNAPDDRPQISREMELILRCVQYCLETYEATFASSIESILNIIETVEVETVEVETVEVETVEQNVPELEWTEVVRLAARHRLAPLLYWCLNTLCPDHLPDIIHVALKREFQHNAKNNLALTTQLIDIVRLLTSHSIPAIPFKGPTLAVAAYDNLLLRQFDDLDILIPRQHLDSCRQLMLSEGYRQDDLSQQEETISQHFLHHITFVKANNYGATVEIHWRIAPPQFSHDAEIEGMWDRLTTVSLASNPVPTFSPEDALVVLCAHGARHHWARLQWVCDIAMLLHSQPDMDWNAVLDRAKATGALWQLLVALSLTQNLLQIPLPDAIVVRIAAAQTIRPLVLQSRGWLFNPEAVVPPPDEQTRYDLAIRERWQDRLRYRWHQHTMTLTPRQTDREALHLPPLLTPLYYPLRLFRLTAKYTIKTLSNLIRSPFSRRKKTD